MRNTESNDECRQLNSSFHTYFAFMELTVLHFSSVFVFFPLFFSLLMGMEEEGQVSPLLHTQVTS